MSHDRSSGDVARPYALIKDWLDRLYGRSPGFFTVCSFDKGKIVATKWYGTDQTARAARSIEYAADRFDLYVSVATHVEPQAGTGKSRGNARTVQSIPGFWADLDIGTDGHKAASLPNPRDEAEALSILDGLPEPSAVVHSGGGLQAWWFFDEPWVFADPSEAAQASEAWQGLLVERAEARGLHVDSVGDLPRILRVPGTQNHKLATPRPVELRTDGPTYPAVELAALGPSNRPQTAAEAPTEVGSPLGPWSDILKPHGWTEAGKRATDGAMQWRRPGKTDGHSAVTDPYGVEVLVNFSASAGLPTGPGKKLTKRRVWAWLNFDGDEKAATAALGKLTKDSPDEWAVTSARLEESHVDWANAFNDTDSEPDWLVEPFIERGRQVALYSDAKSGKSLLTLEIAVALARGEPVLGNPAREPMNVLYIDMENTKQDFIERLRKMGYDGTGLERLHYYSFPVLSDLDTDAGGRELFAAAMLRKGDLAVLDTVSRGVGGDENENDTYHNFYKSTGLRLKAAGIALLRLDHAGKDMSKGMRGASSKTTDVDDVWRLTADGDVITLDRTHSRSHHGADRVILRRMDNPLRHEVVTGAPSTPDDEPSLRDRIDDAVLVASMTVREIAEALHGGNATREQVHAVRQTLTRHPDRYLRDTSASPTRYRRK
jgi:hypothetical protein